MELVRATIGPDADRVLHDNAMALYRPARSCANAPHRAS
jgi:hypothetical protein